MLCGPELTIDSNYCHRLRTSENQYPSLEPDDTFRTHSKFARAKIDIHTAAAAAFMIAGRLVEQILQTAIIIISSGHMRPTDG